MKNKEASSNRVGYYLFMLLLVKPLWQISVWILTTPLRLITSLYFDVLVYLFVSLSDSVDELLHPKLGKMRYRKGMAYWSRWFLGFPFRAGWLLYKNALAVVDSLMMFVISLVCRNFIKGLLNQIDCSGLCGCSPRDSFSDRSLLRT